MKITTLIVFIFSLNVTANSFGQNQKINLKMNSSIKDVLEQLENVSDYRFVMKYDESILYKQVKVNFSNDEIETVLDNLLSGSGFTYKILDRYIAIIPTTENLRADQPQKSISGKVKDSSGASLPGVTVVVKGTTNGVITDLDGKYNLTNVPENGIIQFSFVGMKTQEISVAGKSTINIKMEEATVGIEEVVAVGYGTMQKKDISGSISTFNPGTLKDVPTSNIAKLMQGRIAGVSISNSSGSPGMNPKIRIRGANSMLGSNDPLIILDGVAVNISLSDINPNDINSIEILKDASATAIYGSRGANGVVVVSTKRGASDMINVSVSTDYSIDNVANKYDLLNGPDYIALNNLTLNYTPAITDWQSMIFQTGHSSNTQLGVSGGNEKLKYYFSGSFLDQKGLVINTGYKKYTLRTNIDTKINNRLNVAFNMATIKNDRHNSSSDMSGSKGSPIWNSLIWSPCEPVYEADGTYNKTDQFGSIQWNPYMVAKERVNDSFSTSVLANTKIDFEFVDHLTLSLVYGAQQDFSEAAVFNNQFVTATTGSSRSNSNNFLWQGSNLLTYQNTFDGKHRLSFMIGFEQSSNTSKGFNASGSNLITESVGYDNLGMNQTQSIGSYWSRWTLRSYLSRLTYSLMDKYSLTATYRIDGSSKFQGSNKNSSFPSFAIGWRISEESFMKQIQKLDNLKLRASWGIIGNQAISPYATMAVLGDYNNWYSYGTSNATIGYMPDGAPNPDLRWEETKQLNIGADVSLFKQRLSATLDYYKKNTSGLLQAKQLPGYNGGGTVITNIGEIMNKGFEFSLSGNVVEKGDFGWNLTFNGATLKNEVISIGSEKQIFPGSNYASGFVTSKLFIVKPGESLGSFYGYKFLGLWQESEASEAAKFGRQPGDSKYANLNGDTKIDGSDQQIIGKALPDFTWGLSNNLKYKNLNLNISIEGVQGRDVLNLGYAAAGVAVGDARTITLAEAKNTWTSSNTNTIWPKKNSASNVDFINSSKWIQDGSYVKLRNISLAYTFPKSQLKFGEIRLVLSAQNLLTITKYKGYDPEVTSTGSSDIDQGLDVGSYPTARSYLLGVTLNF